jgi:AraC family transcriptional regulator of adaptative response/methylated-DNA-[protein]-cysteine methyltransferase
MPPDRHADTSLPTTIRYTTAGCSLGRLLLAGTSEGVCTVSLGNSDSELVERLREDFPTARLSRDDVGLAGWLAELLAYFAGRVTQFRLPLHVRGTEFQRQVWEELRRIPYGQTRSYQELAQAIGRPTAARAVARACATNRVAVIIPCHRVLGSDGALCGFSSGIDRKRKLLALEMQRNSQQPTETTRSELNRATA